MFIINKYFFILILQVVSDLRKGCFPEKYLRNLKFYIIRHLPYPNTYLSHLVCYVFVFTVQVRVFRIFCNMNSTKINTFNSYNNNNNK